MVCPDFSLFEWAGPLNGAPSNRCPPTVPLPQVSSAGWWLASDNRYAGGDSAAHGPAEVVARVVWRYRPLRRPRR